MKTVTPEQYKALRGAVRAVLECIPPEGIPSGHLYAALMPSMSLGEYQSLLSAIKATGLVTEKAHYLTRGPKYDEHMK